MNQTSIPNQLELITDYSQLEDHLQGIASKIAERLQIKNSPKLVLSSKLSERYALATRVAEGRQEQYKVYVSKNDPEFHNLDFIKGVEFCFTSEGRLISGFPAANVNLYSAQSASLETSWHSSWTPSVVIRQQIRKEYNQFVHDVDLPEFLTTAITTAQAIPITDSHVEFPIPIRDITARERWQTIELPYKPAVIDPNSRTTHIIRSLENQRAAGCSATLLVYQVGACDIATQYDNCMRQGLSVLNTQGDGLVELRFHKPKNIKR